MKRLFWISLCSIIGTMHFSCKSEKLPEPTTPLICLTLNPTYENGVNLLLEESCAIPGCHIPGGDGPGDYSTYSGMEAFLTEESFERRVIDLKDDPVLGMPLDDELTPDELDIIMCWIAAGYPEN